MLILDYLIRILIALLLGFTIGVERQLTGHAAGIRVNVLICLGACFFTLFPMIYGSDEMFRIAAAVIQGVGFLCSGVIFKEGFSVRGINTAATLWCTSAIGILSSSGKYLYAIIAAAILILSNLLLRPLTKKVSPFVVGDETERKYQVSITCRESSEKEIRQLLLFSCENIRHLHLINLDSGDLLGERVEIIAEYTLVGENKNQILEDIVRQVLENNDVINAGWKII